MIKPFRPSTLFLLCLIGTTLTLGSAFRAVATPPSNAPPSVPTNLKVVTITARKVVLSWDAVTNNPARVTYNLDRDGTLIQQSLEEPTYTDVGVLPGKTYSYQVQAVDPDGNKSEFSPALTATTPAERPVETHGLLFEAWNDIPTTAISALTDDPRYLAGTPDYRALATAADTRTVYADDRHDNYGGRLSGVLVPTDSGKYEFFLRSQDTSQLWLSPDDQTANLARIAEETGCCAAFQEPGDPRTSGPITLISGKKYAIQVLWKAGTNGDYAQVAWRKTEDPTPAGALYPIPGEFLLTSWDASVGPPIITSKTLQFSGVSSNATLKVQAVGDTPIRYQWAPFGGKDIAGATNDTLVLTNVALTNIGSIYTVTLQNDFGSISANYALIPNGALFVEGEDFNFGGGDYIKDQPIGMNGPYPGGSYLGKGTEADDGIDYNANGSNGTDYRSATLVAAGKPNQQLDGLPRGQFDVRLNHVVTSNDAGEWYNYTRVFPSPANDYYVLGRMASDVKPIHVQMDEVISGATNTQQVLQKLGEFRPGRTTASLDDMQIFPLLDDAGNVVTLKSWAGTKSFRMTILPDSTEDFDYFIFVPTTAPPPTSNGFTSVTRIGNNLVLVWDTGTLESADSITGPWVLVPNATSPATFPIAASMKFYRLR